MSTKYKEELVKKDIEEITSDDDATSQCKLELYKTILHKGGNINIKLTGRNIKLKKSSSYQKICGNVLPISRRKHSLYIIHQRMRRHLKSKRINKGRYCNIHPLKI